MMSFKKKLWFTCGSEPHSVCQVKAHPVVLQPAVPQKRNGEMPIVEPRVGKPVAYGLGLGHGFQQALEKDSIIRRTGFHAGLLVGVELGEALAGLIQHIVLQASRLRWVDARTELLELLGGEELEQGCPTAQGCPTCKPKFASS